MHSLKTLYELTPLKFKHISFFSFSDIFLGMQTSSYFLNILLLYLEISFPHWIKEHLSSWQFPHFEYSIESQYIKSDSLFSQILFLSDFTCSIVIIKEPYSELLFFSKTKYIFWRHIWEFKFISVLFSIISTKGKLYI